MKRTVKIVGLLAIVGMLGPVVMAAGAATPWLTQATFEGQTYRRPGMPVDSRPVSMPGMSRGGGEVNSATSGATAGPQLAGDDLISPRSGALVAPTGSGPMYTPQEQGDRQIEQLIKKLG